MYAQIAQDVSKQVSTADREQAGGQEVYESYTVILNQGLIKEKHWLEVALKIKFLISILGEYV